MNILIINGSPKGKHSNSLRLTNAFVKGIREKRAELSLATKIEQLDLCQMNIEHCKGCFACWNRTPGRCCIQDDMGKVIEKELWADLIIYSFPLYYFNLPGSLKNMIDRQLPMLLPFMSDSEAGIGSGSHDSRYDMSGKRYVLISTCGFYSAAGNYDSVQRLFDHLWGKERYETLFCGQGELFSIQALSARTDSYLRLVETAGQEYAAGSISQATKERLQELLFPRETFEKMADASWGLTEDPGEKEDENLIFTRQMAALYHKKNYDGKDRVLEICYTDLGKTYQIILNETGSEVVTDPHLKYTTRIDTPWDVWLSIAQNKIRGDEALAKQMYRVTGDFSLMINWDRFFGSEQDALPEQTKKQDAAGGKKPPIMVTMLLPWITLWVAVPIDTWAGALITLGICGWIPLLMTNYELTIYDKLSIAITALLSLFALVTNQGFPAVDLGYLLFGALWLGSCFTREPLCACYVKYRYNGEDALNNPIFMKTNYILAAAWGILYVLIGIWSWFFSKTDFAWGLIFFNNAMTAMMGIFTIWFEKWYPSRIARGKNILNTKPEKSMLNIKR